MVTTRLCGDLAKVGRAAVLILWIVSAPAAAQPATPSCQRTPGLDTVLATNAVVWLGELHGTVESPSFLSNAVCGALRLGRAVTVGLEVPREEQRRFDTFMASRGTKEDRQALVSGPFWQSEYQDGRRSESMVALMEKLREMGKGRRLTVTLIDSLALQTRAAERDRAMGTAVADAAAKRPDGIVLVMTGNLHARVAQGVPWDSSFAPAAFVLTRLRPGLRIASLNVSYTGGSAWTCTSASASSCEARTLRGNATSAGEGVTMYATVKEGYHGVYSVGTLTASPPAWRK